MNKVVLEQGVALSLGESDAKETLRTSLAVGVDRAVTATGTRVGDSHVLADVEFSRTPALLTPQPGFRRAEYCVAGDLFEVLPAMCEEIKKAWDQ